MVTPHSVIQKCSGRNKQGRQEIGEFEIVSQKQAKKRRREERTQAQQKRSSQSKTEHDEVRDLEELLAEGSIDDYAQACWTLSNGMEGSPVVGQVITLGGPCEEHGSHEYPFRLTLKSMMTISQCTGMETCGEAIKLVASKLPPEQLPCYAHGHQEQFRDLLLYGIELQECIYCGETPNSMRAARSIGWPGEAPVKGIDGHEYISCPDCGSDLLELQGEKIHEWGWKITCLDCDWEMKQAEFLDIKQYCDLMERTRADIAGATEIMESNSINLDTKIKSAAVQTRKILEDIAYATLVSSKDAGAKKQEELQELRYPKDIFRDLGRVHPNFFPTPVEIRDPSMGKPLVVKTKGVLNREKLVQMYGDLSPLAHSTNPLAEPVDLEYFERKIPVWLEEIVNTLDMHQVMLPHHSDHFYIVKMKGDRDGTVQCTPFTQDETGAFACAWPDCVSGASRQYCEFWGRPWAECTLPEKEPEQTQGKMLGAMVDEEKTYERVQDLLDRAGERKDGPGFGQAG